MSTLLLDMTKQIFNVVDADTEKKRNREIKKLEKGIEQLSNEELGLLISTAQDYFLV